MGEPFIAEIRIWGCNFAPRGWTFCNGGTLPISQNTALFSLVGTTYGGDGRTTLGIPNLQGRAPMHPGRGPGLSSYRLGQSGGAETITLTEAQTPSHNHTFVGDGVDGDSIDPAGNTVGLGYEIYASPNNLGDMVAGSLAQTGDGQAHPNFQPYQTFNFCMALQGIYPSRA